MQKKWLTKNISSWIAPFMCNNSFGANVPLEEISHILGHASVSTTFDIYCGEIQGRDNILDFLSSNFDPITHLARKAG